MTDLENDGVGCADLIIFCMAGWLHGVSSVWPSQLGGGGCWKPGHEGLSKGVPR